jgi:hypothetical protein
LRCEVDKTTIYFGITFIPNQKITAVRSIENKIVSG